MSWNLVYLPDKKVRKNIIEIWYQYLGIVREKTLRRNKFLLLVALIQHFHTIFHKLNCSNLWASYEASKLWKMSPYLFSNRTMTTWCCLLTTFKAMSIEVSSNWPNKTRFDFWAKNKRNPDSSWAHDYRQSGIAIIDEVITVSISTSLFYIGNFVVWVCLLEDKEEASSVISNQETNHASWPKLQHNDHKWYKLIFMIFVNLPKKLTWIFLVILWTDLLCPPCSSYLFAWYQYIKRYGFHLCKLNAIWIVHTNIK